MKLSPREQRRNRFLILAFALGIALYLLPISGLLFNSRELVFGFPISILAIFLASVYLVVITVIAFLILFLPWAKRFDEDQQ